jgi:hypothetical protein
MLNKCTVTVTLVDHPNMLEQFDKSFAADGCLQRLPFERKFLFVGLRNSIKQVCLQDISRREIKPARVEDCKHSMCRFYVGYGDHDQITSSCGDSALY